MLSPHEPLASTLNASINRDTCLTDGIKGALEGEVVCDRNPAAAGLVLRHTNCGSYDLETYMRYPRCTSGFVVRPTALADEESRAVSSSNTVLSLSEVGISGPAL